MRRDLRRETGRITIFAVALVVMLGVSGYASDERSSAELNTAATESVAADSVLLSAGMTGKIAAGDEADAGVSRAPDGTYEPDGFGWTGGSGRLEYIKCLSVKVKGGEAMATIEFASDKYDFVKVDGHKYAREGSGNSVFTIPVRINENTGIKGRTTAMSQPHWIDYDIFVLLKSADGAEDLYAETGVPGDTLSEDAPPVMGLSGGSAGETDDAELCRSFTYDGGICLLQIDVGTRSVLKPEAGTEGEGNGLYSGKIVNYLIVPEKTELPAGLDKAFVVIRQPVEAEYTVEDIKTARYDEIVLAKPDLIIVPGEQIKRFLWFGKSRREATEELLRSAETLGIPVLFDRSEQDRGRGGEAGWENIYDSFR